MLFVIEGERFTLKSLAGDGIERKMTFKLDPAKTPKEIDITSLDGREKETTAASIYKLEKDRLTICIPHLVEDRTIRPKEFKAGTIDGPILLMTLERVKSK